MSEKEDIEKIRNILQTGSEKDFVKRIMYPNISPKMQWDAPISKPSPSLNEWFRNNPKTTGMADFDSRSVVLNPHSTLTEKQKEGLLINEKSRLFMKESGMIPQFQLTPEQATAFKEYGNGDDLAKRETIVGRILSGDQSVGKTTREQIDFANKVRTRMARTTHTHLMSWSEHPYSPGIAMVYPLVVRDDKTGKLKVLSHQDAIEHAIKTDEFLPFTSNEEADWFSKNYKKVWDNK
jgi:hypothetical protein